MIIKENDSRQEQLVSVAKAMMTAARTAPKGCGIDHLEMATVFGDEISQLSVKMREISERIGKTFFCRDATNLENSEAVVLIGCHAAVRGLNCGLCGYPSCREKMDKAAGTPCTFDITDLGIAVGSAVSIASDNRIDNRIMYSAGMAARELGYLEECPVIWAIPLSATGKSIYFDRKDGLCSK